MTSVLSFVSMLNTQIKDTGGHELVNPSFVVLIRLMGPYEEKFEMKIED